MPATHPDPVTSAEPSPRATLPARIAAEPPATSAARAISATPAPTGWFDRRASAVAVTAVYSAFTTYAYVAWFRGATERPFFFETQWAQENPFALRTYAGGADKWGHGWASYALTRGTTELLVAGGWPRLPSSLVAAGLASAAFTVQESLRAAILRVDTIAQVASDAVD